MIRIAYFLLPLHPSARLFGDDSQEAQNLEKAENRDNDDDHDSEEIGQPAICVLFQKRRSIHGNE